MNIFEKLASKWWFFLIIAILYFVPSYSSVPLASSQETSALIVEVLKNPLTLSFPITFPFIKIIMLLLIIGLAIFQNKVSRLFISFSLLLSLAILVFQNMANTENYGFSILIGNMIVQTISLLYLFYELVVNKNDFKYKKTPLWKYWVGPSRYWRFGCQWIKMRCLILIPSVLFQMIR